MNSQCQNAYRDAQWRRLFTMYLGSMWFRLIPVVVSVVLLVDVTEASGHILSTGSDVRMHEEDNEVRSDGTPGTMDEHHLPVFEAAEEWRMVGIKSTANISKKFKRQSESSKMDLCSNKNSGCDTAMTLEEINKFLKDYAKKHKKFAKLKQIGESYEKRPIYAMEIKVGKSRRYLSTIVAEFGIHAREWASPASAVYFLEHLWKESGTVVVDTHWYIVPVLNPDGYLFSTTKKNMWRKNRRPLESSECYGVDLNRNFGTSFRDFGDKAKCREYYSGPSNFSEPESRVLRDFVKTINPSNIDGYISIHSCLQALMHPYAYTNETLPRLKLKMLKAAGKKMANAMKQVRNLTYPVTSVYNLADRSNYGSVLDFMYKDMKIPYVFTLELGDKSNFKDNDYQHCFHPLPEAMNALRRECYAALIELANHINDRKIEEIRNKVSGRNGKAVPHIMGVAPYSVELNCRAFLFSLILLLSSNIRN